MTECDCKTFTTHRTHGNPWCQCGHQYVSHVVSGGVCTQRTDPDEPTYAAAEVKVLTETASKVAYALGRKDAVAEINQWIFDQQHKRGTNGAKWNAYMNVAAQLRNIASQPPSAASDATSGVLGHPEVSEAVRSPREPCGHPDCPCGEGNTP